MAEAEDVKREYGLELADSKECMKNTYDAVLLAVAHNKFRELDFSKFVEEKSVIYDIKGFLDKNIVSGRL